MRLILFLWLHISTGTAQAVLVGTWMESSSHGRGLSCRRQWAWGAPRDLTETCCSLARSKHRHPHKWLTCRELHSTNDFTSI